MTCGSTAWTRLRFLAVTCAEGYQAANETGGTLTCAYDEVAGDVVLEVAVPKCLSVVSSLDDPSTGVSHECRDILYQGSCVATRPEGYEADGRLSTTSLRCLSLGEFVSGAQSVYPSCSQMLCSDTLTQSGVGVNSSCGSASIGDTCMVFCTLGYQAVLNETSTLTCVWDRCDKPSLSFFQALTFLSVSASPTMKRVLFAVRWVTWELATGMSPSFYVVAMVTSRVPWNVRRS